MRLGLGFVFCWIHVIALSVVASEVAKDAGWNAFAVGAAWIVGGVCGIFPIVRTIVLAALLLTVTVWWKALLITAVASLVLLFIEGIGKGILKGEVIRNRG